MYTCVLRLENNLKCHPQECSATSLWKCLSLSWRSVIDQWSSGILLSLLPQSALIITIHHHIQPFSQYYAGFVTVVMYYNLESDKICLAFFILLRTALTTWVLLWFHRNFVIFFCFCREKSLWNFDRDCMNFHHAFNNKISFMVLILPFHEHGVPFHLIKLIWNFFFIEIFHFVWLVFF